MAKEYLTLKDKYIKALIDDFEIDAAKRELHAALQNPTAETYYLASMLAESNIEKRNYLNKALDLDPFHEEAYAELELNNWAPRAIPTLKSDELAGMEAQRKAEAIARAQERQESASKYSGARYSIGVDTGFVENANKSKGFWSGPKKAFASLVAIIAIGIAGVVAISHSNIDFSGSINDDVKSEQSNVTTTNKFGGIYCAPGTWGIIFYENFHWKAMDCGDKKQPCKIMDWSDCYQGNFTVKENKLKMYCDDGTDYDTFSFGSGVTAETIISEDRDSFVTYLSDGGKSASPWLRVNIWDDCK